MRKLIAKTEDGEVITYGGFDGWIEDENMVTFTINIAPGDLEEGETTLKDTLGSIQTDIDYLLRIKKFLIAVKPWEPKIEYDFYWSDGDLLLSIELPLIAFKIIKK